MRSRVVAASGLSLALYRSVMASCVAVAQVRPPHPATVRAAGDAEEEEGGEPPDGTPRAPQGTGHGLSRTSGEDRILGDACGIRPFFGRYGVTFDISETAEALGNPVGGLRRGAVFEVTYQAQPMKGVQLQPDLQYVIDNTSSTPPAATATPPDA